jgi:hypothetical protein
MISRTSISSFILTVLHPEFYADQLKQLLILETQISLTVVRQLLEKVRVADCVGQGELRSALLELNLQLGKSEELHRGQFVEQGLGNLEQFVNFSTVFFPLKQTFMATSFLLLLLKLTGLLLLVFVLNHFLHLPVNNVDLGSEPVVILTFLLIYIYFEGVLQVDYGRVEVRHVQVKHS